MPSETKYGYYFLNKVLTPEEYKLVDAEIIKRYSDEPNKWFKDLNYVEKCGVLQEILETANVK